MSPVRYKGTIDKGKGESWGERKGARGEMKGAEMRIGQRSWEK